MLSRYNCESVINCSNGADNLTSQFLEHLFEMYSDEKFIVNNEYSKAGEGQVGSFRHQAIVRDGRRGSVTGRMAGVSGKESMARRPSCANANVAFPRNS